MRYQKGDTIIEVVLAFAIFSLVAIGTMAILSSGVSTTQRDLEISLVRQQIDSQAELLRYLHDTQHNVAGSTWENILSSKVVNSPTPLSGSCDGSFPSAFYIQPTINANPTLTTISAPSIPGSAYVTPTTYAMVDYANAKSQGVWIQVTKAQVQTQNPSSAVNAYDFYIHACWDAVGVNSKMTSGTIVRIYE